MLGNKKLTYAKRILQEHFADTIILLAVNPTKPFMKIIFRDSTILYIRYNDFNEYSYQIIFSEEPNNWCRFDNYDNLWDVSTRPHHFHPNGEDPAIMSPMNGDPENDMPLLIPYIKKNNY